MAAVAAAAACSSSASSKEPCTSGVEFGDYLYFERERLRKKGSSIKKKERPPPIDTSGVDKTGTKPSKSPSTPKMEKKIGHRRVDTFGETTYKKTTSSALMSAIQLGIGHSVGGLSAKPERDVLMQDFAVVESVFFPSEGSNLTAAHKYPDFRFKTYAPVAFRYFRELFGIQPDDFLLSLCNDLLRELSNPGASGSVFYLTSDDEFIIKTVQHKEADFLQKLLPGYYMNLNQNPRTLLPKFYGLYTYQCGGKNIRLCCMNNLLPSHIKMHQKFDLKGSTYKRRASKYERSKRSPTLKDLDFIEEHPEGLLLDGQTYNALMLKTIPRDCRVLESFKIMDYSLLVGIHNLDQAAREKNASKSSIQEGMHTGIFKQLRQKNADDLEKSDGKGESSRGESQSAAEEEPSTSQNQASRQVLSRSRSYNNRQRVAAFSTPREIIQTDHPVRTQEQDEEEDDEEPTGGIPAKNAKGERLLLFIGIIDILQCFKLKKKLEHTFKAMVHDGDTVSVCRPSFYAQRFQDFLAKAVFRKIPVIKHSPSKKGKSFSGPHGTARRTQPTSFELGTTMSTEPPTPIKPDILPSTPPPPFETKVHMSPSDPSRRTVTEVVTPKPVEITTRTVTEVVTSKPVENTTRTGGELSDTVPPINETKSIKSVTIGTQPDEIMFPVDENTESSPINDPASTEEIELQASTSKQTTADTSHDEPLNTTLHSASPGSLLFMSMEKTLQLIKFIICTIFIYCLLTMSNNEEKSAK